MASSDEEKMEDESNLNKRFSELNLKKKNYDPSEIKLEFDIRFFKAEYFFENLDENEDKKAAIRFVNEIFNEYSKPDIEFKISNCIENIKK